ncbi:uncharacterized protein J7T54_000491 [Emericellopsis cladophorae]|uniref:histidine kinase n=1 Tax=Emericellopsis cladophorae TaxID=2686198 RepID=A0A9P9XVH1_9HYPO|nr:uncharacterized protein J7T54_000491 [Emericellopsis cladophorae]KAI6778373.1 hypothetical protein J7T54_000491 [Emericellopsis cladophorae]
MACCAPAKRLHASEGARERETFRYYPLLSSYFRFARDGQAPPSLELTTAPDSVLTALAQLGIHQTGTQRAFVSLFDATHQYILAEATPESRIAPSLPSLSQTVPLTLRGTAIPRDQGTCDHVLSLTANAQDSGDDTKLPLSVVPNLTKDKRFSSRPFCQFGEAGQFYAGVPIRTRRGIDIGAYCVMSTVPPPLWDEQCTQRLRDISGAITEHLELRRARAESRQHERLNRGLGSFIEGKGTLSGWQSGANTAAFVNDDSRPEGALDAQQQRLETEDGGEQQASGVLQHDELRHPPPAVATATFPNRDLDVSHVIFSKAANILREGFEVDGCAFLSTAQAADWRPRPFEEGEPANRDITTEEATLTGSSSEDQGRPLDSEARNAPCGLIGFSTTESSSINHPVAVAPKFGTMPTRFLAKLLKRYPQGKIFHFDAEGELQSSDASEEGDGMPEPRPINDSSEAASPPREQRRRARRKTHEVDFLHRAFPSARSVVFAPVWDSRNQRWLAGGFMYTCTASRIFTTQGELSFFLAFGKLVASEVNSLETYQANKAKSDTLGSLSHELRSPLHGAVLSCELLSDTDLGVFQGNAVHTIETCCRTLLDTIDHLLDYSKVNSFAEENEQSSGNGSRPRHKGVESAGFGKKSLYRHVRLDALVEEVSESVYAGFSFQSMSAARVSMQSGPGESFLAARKSFDGGVAMDHLGRAGRDSPWGSTSLYVSIDPSCDWLFHVQPGVVRRIVMNLLGNALKYTTKGMIRVSLEQMRTRPSPRERLVKITVQDTGKGIGEEFLRHKLFQPFSQEDELAPGTGLGLSLVKKVTAKLGGKITVDSKIGVGTTVAVTLPLQPSVQVHESPSDVFDPDDGFDDRVRELRGRRVGLCGFGPAWGEQGRALVETICHRWLGLELSVGEATPPDIVIWSDDALPYTREHLDQLARIPNVVICRHALATRQLSGEFENFNRDRVFEFLAQPIGPRSLARAAVDAVRRRAGLPKLLLQTRPPGPQRARSLHDESPSTRAAKGAWLEHPSLPQPNGKWGAGDHTPSVNEQENGIGRGLAVTENGVRKKYLLVDDNPINLKVLSALMRKLGQAHELASNGQEAVEAYMQDPATFAGIFMDISMPVMDGLEATRLIREHEQKTHAQAVVILALTGLASHRTHQHALESGIDLFLTKPVSLKVLREALQSKCEAPP